MSDEIFDPDMDVDAGDASRWTTVDRVSKRRTPGIVLSVRVSAEIAQGLEALARKRGVTLSQAARDCLVAVVQQADAVPYGLRVADHAFSDESATASVTFTQLGSSSSGLLVRNITRDEL